MVHLLIIISGVFIVFIVKQATGKGVVHVVEAIQNGTTFHTSGKFSGRSSQVGTIFRKIVATWDDLPSMWDRSPTRQPRFRQNYQKLFAQASPAILATIESVILWSTESRSYLCTRVFASAIAIITRGSRHRPSYPLQRRERDCRQST